MLAIVLVPSIALLIIGVGGAGYLVHEGYAAQDWADTIANSPTVELSNTYTVQLSEERRLSLLRLSGDMSVDDELLVARGQVNASVLKLRPGGHQSVPAAPTEPTASTAPPKPTSAPTTTPTSMPMDDGSMDGSMDPSMDSSMDQGATTTPSTSESMDGMGDMGDGLTHHGLLHMQPTGDGSMGDGSMGDMGGQGASTDLLGRLPEIRAGVDAGRLPAKDVYEYYNQLVDETSASMEDIALAAPDPETAFHGTMANDLFAVTESMSRSNALAAAGVAKGGMDDWSFGEFAQQVGNYHAQLDAMTRHMSESQMTAHHKVVMSPQWRQVTNEERYLLLHGPGTGASGLPEKVADWQKSAANLHQQLLDLYSQHHSYAASFAADTGKRIFTNSLIGGAAVLLLALIALLVAIRLSNGLVNRLKGLRENTLDLADNRLPDIVTRLRKGEQINVDEEVPPLQYGTDEIGQVAEAFNKAQRTAVTAAAQEAKIQIGVRAVFLNIAHRSQVVVHRQLDVLDKAEREQENPEQLEQLFQLDHLATRARRNAENLLILGGDQPGRQWRNPVPLVEIVRSAVGETEHYKRVVTGKLSDVRMAGKVVADLIHLLAELVDNATSFSPPESRVEVSGNLVGKGLVVEIEDQGIGLAPEQLGQINRFLSDPPDFGVMSLSEDARLGLFVVSQLAMRHKISVRLVESIYGGVRAIVLVPADCIADEGEPAPAKTVRPVERRRLTAAGNGQDPEATGRIEGAIMIDEEAPEPEPASEGWVRRAPTAPPSTGDGRTRPGANGDSRPALPRRRRQSNLVPQLADDLTPPAEQATDLDDAEVTRSAERARNRMLAFQRGTRNGRAGHDPNEW